MLDFVESYLQQNRARTQVMTAKTKEAPEKRDEGAQPVTPPKPEPSPELPREEAQPQNEPPPPAPPTPEPPAPAGGGAEFPAGSIAAKLVKFDRAIDEVLELLGVSKS